MSTEWAAWQLGFTCSTTCLCTEVNLGVGAFLNSVQCVANRARAALKQKRTWQIQVIFSDRMSCQTF